jgi:hypothetical protein
VGLAGPGQLLQGDFIISNTNAVWVNVFQSDLPDVRISNSVKSTRKRILNTSCRRSALPNGRPRRRRAAGLGQSQAGKNKTETVPMRISSKLRWRIPAKGRFRPWACFHFHVITPMGHTDERNQVNECSLG